MNRLSSSKSKIEKESIALFKKNLLKESHYWFKNTDYFSKLKKQHSYGNREQKYETRNMVTGRLQLGWGGIYFLLSCVVVACDNSSWQSCSHNINNVFYSAESFTLVYSILFIIYVLPLFIFQECLGLLSQGNYMKSCRMVSYFLDMLYVLSLFGTVTFCSKQICNFSLELLQVMLRLYHTKESKKYGITKVFINLTDQTDKDCMLRPNMSYVASMKHCIFFNKEVHVNFYENTWFMGNENNYLYLLFISTVLLILCYLITKNENFKVFKMFIFIVIINWITTKSIVIMNSFFFYIPEKQQLITEATRIISELGMVNLSFMLYNTIIRSSSIFILSTFASYFNTDTNIFKISLYTFWFYILNIYSYLKNEEHELAVYSAGMNKKDFAPSFASYNFIKCNGYINLLSDLVKSSEVHKKPGSSMTYDIWQKFCLFFSSYSFLFNTLFVILMQLLGPINVLSEIRYEGMQQDLRKTYSYKSLIKLHEHKREMIRKFETRKSSNSNYSSSVGTRSRRKGGKVYNWIKRRFKKHGRKIELGVSERAFESGRNIGRWGFNLSTNGKETSRGDTCGSDFSHSKQKLKKELSFSIEDKMGKHYDFKELSVDESFFGSEPNARNQFVMDNSEMDSSQLEDYVDKNFSSNESEQQKEYKERESRSTVGRRNSFCDLKNVDHLDNSNDKYSTGVKCFSAMSSDTNPYTSSIRSTDMERIKGKVQIIGPTKYTFKFNKLSSCGVSSRTMKFLETVDRCKYFFIKKFGKLLLFLVIYVLVILRIMDFKRNQNLISEMILYSLYKTLLMYIVCMQLICSSWIFGFHTQANQCGVISCLINLFAWLVYVPFAYIYKHLFHYLYLFIPALNIIGIIICCTEVKMKLKLKKEIEMEREKEKEREKERENTITEDQIYMKCWKISLNKNKLVEFLRCVYWLYFGNIDVLRRNINVGISGNEQKYIPFFWSFLMKYVNCPMYIIVLIKHLKENFIEFVSIFEMSFSVKVEIIILILALLVSVTTFFRIRLTGYYIHQDVIIPEVPMKCMGIRKKYIFNSN